MKHYNHMKVEVSKDVLDSMTCDVCGKRFMENHSTTRFFCGSNRNEEIFYYNVISGHHEWGHDSVDSIEHHEVCSTECLRNFEEKYWEDTYDSAYLEINKERTFGTIPVDVKEKN